MIDLVRELKTINVIDMFENDPRKIMDVSVLTLIVNVRNWKTHTAIGFHWQQVNIITKCFVLTFLFLGHMQSLLTFLLHPNDIYVIWEKI